MLHELKNLARPSNYIRTKKKKRCLCTDLLLEVEFFYNSAVAFLVIALQILQVRAAVCDHLQKTTARVLVFKVFL